MACQGRIHLDTGGRTNVFEKRQKRVVKCRRDVIVHARTHTHTHTHKHPVHRARLVGCVARFQQPLQQLGFTTSECSFFLLLSSNSCHFFLLVGVGVAPAIFTVYKLHTCSSAAVCWRNGEGSRLSRETNAEEEEEGWRRQRERPTQSATPLVHQVHWSRLTAGPCGDFPFHQTVVVKHLWYSGNGLTTPSLYTLRMASQTNLY